MRGGGYECGGLRAVGGGLGVGLGVEVRGEVVPRAESRGYACAGAHACPHGRGWELLGLGSFGGVRVLDV